MSEDDLTCRYCDAGPFGNKGAQTNHENACDHNPENQTAERPARRETQDARPAPTSGQDAGAGQTAGDLLFTITHGDDLPPEARANAVTQGIGLLQQIANRYNELRFRNEELKEQRAQSAQLERAVEYPECEECGYQFGPDDLGTDEQVRCPGCDTLYNVMVEERDEQAA